MAIYSYVTFTGDGADTTFSFAGITEMFPNTFLSYFSQLDVYVDGVLMTPTSDWSVTDTVSKIITFTTAPANGATIKIARDTKKDGLLHSFTAGSIITANDLNNNTKQIFYNVQELVDAQGLALGLTPAGDKWDFEGKPTYNAAPAAVSSGLTTLAQVNALLDGAAVGTFDEVDSFKFNGTGAATDFDLTGVTDTGLTADAVLVHVNGIMQDPDVFSSHTPKGSIGGSKAVLWKKYTLPYTAFKSGSSYSPTISGGSNEVSTFVLHNLAVGEIVTAGGFDVTATFMATADAKTLTMTVRQKNDDNTAFEDGSFSSDLLSGADPTYNSFAGNWGSRGSGYIFPLTSNGKGCIEVALTLGGAGSDAVADLTAGSMDIWLCVESPDSNNVTSVTSSASSINANKYSLAYVSGTPRITFNTAPALDDVIVVRVLSGTFQGRVEDGSITTAKLADDAVTAAKINVGAGAANRILVFDTSGDATAQAGTAAIISDFNTAVRTNRLDQMAVPTADVSMSNQKITNLATGTAVGDAVTKAQLDAAVTASGMVAGHTTGTSVPHATATAIAYPSGFSTYPKAVTINLTVAATVYAPDVSFYTDAGTTTVKKFPVFIEGTGASAMTVTCTGTTTGITVTTSISGSYGMTADIIWFK